MTASGWEGYRPRSGPFATLPQPNTTYALGLLPHVPDTRFPAALPSGPFQITKYVPYTAFTGDPPHRFFQMWQQFDEGKLDLFAWVDVTAGIGPQNVAPTPTALNTLQGGEAMGFFNMSEGDAPMFFESERPSGKRDKGRQRSQRVRA